MIEVKGLTKDYGARLAIDNLTFSGAKGEVIGFLGPNGAGKTTTMRILAGYMPPTSGQASVAGFDVVEKSIEVRKRVGYLPETVPLYNDMTVYDYLKFMADLHQVNNAEDRVEDVLEMVQMIDRIDSFISSLSKGMRQRVGLAQALLPDPELLILDEPTIGLDPAQIIEVRNLIKEIGQEHTVLLSTHILPEAQQICDRVLIINKGKIVAEDTPERLGDKLGSGRRIGVRFSGDAEAGRQALEGISGARVATEIEAGFFEVQTDTNKDLRPVVARKMVEAGLDLLELRYLGMSLEEIFLELTAEQEVGVEAEGQSQRELSS